MAFGPSLHGQETIAREWLARRFIQEKLKDLGELDRETLWCIGRRVYSGPNGSHLQRDAFRLEVVAAGCSKLHPFLRTVQDCRVFAYPQISAPPPPIGGGLGPMIAWIIAGGHFLQFGRPLKGPSCLIRPLCGKV